MKIFDIAKQIRDAEPERILISDYARQYSAADVERISGQVYRYLKDHHIGREDIVMIHIQRSAAIPLCFYGILRSGACTVVVDGEASEEYVSYYRHDTKPTVVIDEELYEHITTLPPLQGWVNPQPHDAAFIPYTSSSTGKPKGCIHEYGDVDLLLKCYEDEPLRTITSEERVAFTTEFYDIASYGRLLAVLATGCYIHLIEREASHDVNKYASIIRDKRLTTAMLIPRFMDVEFLSSLPSLRYLSVSFEVVEKVFSQNLAIYNEYGMSESVLEIAWFLVDREYDITPVGKLFELRETVLVDEKECEVASGEIGEVAFSNPYFRGYLNKPEETKKAVHHGRYHTGDMGYINQEGNLVILGRKEDLLKVNEGYIVPSLIQAEIKKLYPGNPICVRAFAGMEKNRIVVFHLTDLTIDPDEAEKSLRGKLPQYMLPTDYVELEMFPILTAGKLNRLELKRIFEEKMIKN